jgi:cation:H+ antiporter
MTIETVALFVGGLLALLGGAELLVRGASRLAGRFGIPPVVIGLTVVAFGTSAPEVAVSVGAALHQQGDLALGNVVGSNTFNLLFILGLSACITPLAVAHKLLRVDIPVLVLVSLAVGGLMLDGRLGRTEGVLLVAGLLGYVALQLRGARPGPAASDTTAAPPARAAVSIALVVVGLALLVLGARWLVESSVVAARAFGVSELVIGLTIVSAGTSLPEVATSVVAALRGERDIAIGNVVGSNVFNLLGVLGAAAAVAPDGLPVAASVRAFDLPVMLGATIVILPIAFTGRRIARLEGLLLLGAYVAYVVFLVLAAQQDAALPTYQRVLLFGGLPVVVVGLAASLWPRRAPSPGA